jgi:hypothetical protein
MELVDASFMSVRRGGGREGEEGGRTSGEGCGEPHTE